MSNIYSFIYTFPTFMMCQNTDEILSAIWKEKSNYLYLLEHHKSNKYLALVKLNCDGCKLPEILGKPNDSKYTLRIEYSHKKILYEWSYSPHNIEIYRQYCRHNDILYFSNNITQAIMMFELKLYDIEKIITAHFIEAQINLERDCKIRMKDLKDDQVKILQSLMLENTKIKEEMKDE